MIQDLLANLTEEERGDAISYLEEYIDTVCIGDGDYQVGLDDEIIID